MFMRLTVIASFIPNEKCICLLLVLLFLAHSLLFTVLQPFKDNLFNTIDGVLAAVGGCMVLLCMFDVFVSSLSDTVYFLLLIPLVYFTLYVVSKILLQTNLLHSQPMSSRYQKVRDLMERIAGYHSPHGHETHIEEGDEDSLPHRLIQPKQYRYYGTLTQDSTNIERIA